MTPDTFPEGRKRESSWASVLRGRRPDRKRRVYNTTLIRMTIINKTLYPSGIYPASGPVGFSTEGKVPRRWMLPFTDCKISFFWRSLSEEIVHHPIFGVADFQPAASGMARDAE
jgi:hypothetical protein